MSDSLSSQLHIAVCDDDSRDRQAVTELTKEILSQEGIAFAMETYSDASALLAAISQGKGFEILLLDVMMDGLNGMELAAALRRQENPASIVFISSNREMALRGYEVSACRYLAKPVERERLREALLFCCRENYIKREILLPTAAGQRRISIPDILYAETWDRGVRIHLAGELLVIKLHISELLARLPKNQFVLCHRAYIVNLAQVKTIRVSELELNNGELIPMSKYRYDNLRVQLIAYLES